jgi:hypothetical protein
MVSFWRSLRRTRQQSYKLARLVDTRRHEPCDKGGIHIVCDIDKTYLETEFESVIRMARIAFEAAADKVTVAGASEVLELARWGELAAPLPTDGEFPRCLHFVSSSPPQLRSVLAEKMMMDGLDWSSETFKDQAYNIRMGRMDLLRQHVAYKSLAILNLIAGAGPNARFVLIGDNAEQDAYIYTGIKLLLDGQLSETGYRLYLEHAGVETDVAADLAQGISARNGARIDTVLIRNVPGYVLPEEPPLTDIVHQFDNFFQAALLLMVRGILPVTQMWPLVRSFHNHYGMTQKYLGALLQAVQAGVPETSEVGQAAAAAFALLQPDEALDREPASVFSRSLAANSSKLSLLGEGIVLQHAKRWQQKMQEEKAKREE